MLHVPAVQPFCLLSIFYGVYTCVHVQLLSHIQLFLTSWIITLQAPLSMGFPRQEYWSGYPLTSPGNLSNPRIKPSSPALAGRLFTTGPLQKLMVWIHHILFTSSPVNEHYLLIASLGQLWIMWPSRFVYKSWCGQLPFFLESYPGVELNKGYNCVLNFIRHCASILQGGCRNIHSHWQGMSIHLSPYSCQHLLASI